MTSRSYWRLRRWIRWAPHNRPSIGSAGLAGIGATEVSCVISARSSAHFRDQLSALAELADLPGRWQIVTQITRMLDGAAEGRALLVDGLAGRIR